MAEIEIIGNIGADPRILDGGGFVFNVAETESWKDKNTGEEKSKTQWFSVFVRGEFAEKMRPRVAKGKRVMVRGKLSMKVEDTPDYGIKIQASIAYPRVTFILPASQDEAGASTTASDAASSPTHQNSQESRTGSNAPRQSMADVLDDDIPY